LVGFLFMIVRKDNPQPSKTPNPTPNPLKGA
jgi:hypothetical protein